MTKTIISTLLASSMMVSAITPAYSQLVSNGGVPQYSITEIQANLDDGSFYNYPGVIRLNDFGVRVGPSGSYLFSDTFAPGMALPEITDSAALQRAIDSDATILVASNEWVLPIPAVFVELGRQNGVDGVTFMAHYLDASAGIDSDAFGEYAERQTQAVLDTLGVTSITIDTQALINTGLTEAQAQAIADNAVNLAVTEANKRIDGLTAENMTLVGEISNLKSQISGLMSNIDSLTVEHAAEVRRLGATISGLRLANGFFNVIATGVTSELLNVSSALGLTNNVSNQDRLDAIQALKDEVSTLRNATVDLKYSNVEAAVADPNSNYGHDVAINTIEGGFTPFVSSGAFQVRTSEGFIRASVWNGQVTIHGRGQPNASRYYTDVPINVNVGITAHQLGAIISRAGTTTPTYSELNGTVGPNYNSEYNASVDIESIVDAIDIDSAIETAINEAYDQGYADGYADGYNDGYADGFADGSAR